MLIQSLFDIRFQLANPTAMIAMLHLHPSLERALRGGNHLNIERLTAEGPTDWLPHPERVRSTEYLDSFGNRCTRFVAPPGIVRLTGTATSENNGLPDPIATEAQQAPIEHLPSEVLQFLLPSRYCEVDQFVAIAQDLFGWMTPGWTRAVAIRDWVHEKVIFDYKTARPTKSAMDVFTERIGVCRDFQHLAITLSRCQNIPARYVTGYLGDILHPYTGPGDFSAWYEVFLDGRWWTMDARHNQPRVGRVLMATGRDAADVAITTSFGNAYLDHFYVDSYQVAEDGTKLPIPGEPPPEVAATAVAAGAPHWAA
jgi:transglutaminase-like putative cysteine protease